jgi:hypothetical protein
MMQPRSLQRWLMVPIAIIFVPALILGGIAYFIAFAAGIPLLLLTTWVIAAVRGPYVVIVYSNSPRWQTYFEEQILPAAGMNTAVLNWSERRAWRWSLPVTLFRVFGGSSNFNPLALIIRPCRWPRALRFFKAFQHGHLQEVERLRQELLEVLIQTR